ncbi:MAG: hypothetical protein RBT64_07570 [Trichloromonas sp.]|jgi:ABC-type dipeptide/oligopeptide/nickel transport system permease component|nr:hypothetical protein [Trichloromonas sp.]
MNGKISQHMILLGLCALIFYAVMLVSGKLPLEVMPQFVVSAIIFMSSGYFMRKATRTSARDEDEEETKATTKRLDLDWPWLTALLNWSAAFLILGVMAIILMKPVGLSFQEALHQAKNQEQQVLHTIP